MRAEDAQGTPTQIHTSPSILVYEDNTVGITTPFSVHYLMNVQEALTIETGRFDAFLKTQRFAAVSGISFGRAITHLGRAAGRDLLVAWSH